MATELGLPRRHAAVPVISRRTHRVRLAGKATSPFADVLCAVDDSRGSAEALRQAAAIAAPKPAPRCLTVHEKEGTGISADGNYVSDRLLAASEGRDLLAIGCHGGSRLGGMMLGGIATQVAHRANVPLLIARHTADEDFPRDVLLASDGSPGSWVAMELAARLARARGSSLQVVYVPNGHPERYRELFKQVDEIERLTGMAPLFLDTPGDPARRIAEAARAAQSSLVVIGKRGRHGLKSLGSVSERVVHRAPCSVLVVPPR